jgi:hypothetical protein
MNVSGGIINDGLWARDTSTVTLYGYDFRATGGLSLNGEKVLGTGLLTGKWFDGTPWATNIRANESGATIRAIPEPSTLALLGMGAAGLLVCAWPRRGGDGCRWPADEGMTRGKGVRNHYWKSKGDSHQIWRSWEKMAPDRMPGSSRFRGCHLFHLR